MWLSLSGVGFRPTPYALQATPDSAAKVNHYQGYPKWIWECMSSVVEKIWAIILEVVAVVAEFTGADSEDLIMQIIENEKDLQHLEPTL